MRRRVGLGATVAGLVLAAAAQRSAPVAGPPLFDGVIVEAAYQWVAPPSGHVGGAQGSTQSVPVQNGQSPDLAVGTTENPPQAQVFAGAGYLDMPSGTTTIQVSIEPIAPTTQPSDGVIAGNVYRIALTSQDGQAVKGQSGGGVTVELRGPHNLANATIERFDGSRWSPLSTDSVGEPNMFAAVVTDFGDFALVTSSSWSPAPDGGSSGGQVGPVPAGSGAGSAVGSPSSSGGSGTTILLVAGIALAMVVAVAGFGLLLYARRAPKPAHRAPARPLRTRPPGYASPPPRQTPLPRKHRRR